MKGLLSLLCIGITFAGFSQPYAGEDGIGVLIENKGAGCTPPSTTTYMQMNNVRAMIHTAGNLWQVPGQNLSTYEVPKNTGIMALFTSALWLGGVDGSNQLKLAALRYRSGQDYWTGPLTQLAAETDFETCAAYDRHYVTSQDDIREFDAWFQAGLDDAQNGTATQDELFPNYEIPLIVKEWPAHGDQSVGQDYYLAPFFDRDEDGHYSWEDGDYPWHDIHKTKDCATDRRVSLYGDLNYWWIMNDKGNIHTETGADPIGMEIRAQAFAFASNDEINNMTFYNYELINRGSQTLYDTYFGCFTDGALGDPFDDYVGCDVNRGLAYYYNGDNYDGDNSGFFGYGDNPPAVGVDFFEGPFQDNDSIDNAYGIGAGEALNGIGYGDGVIDNERYGMRRFCYYSNTTNGAPPSQTDPIIAVDYYNYMRGFWKDGTRFFYGGSGHQSDPAANQGVTADFMFPADTDPLGWGTGGFPQPDWTEQTAGNQPNDRRFVQSAGPFVLKPGAVNNITVGVVWARGTGGDPFASVEVLKRADDKAQSLFENCFKVLDAPHAPILAIQELENEIILTISNPLNSNNYLEQYEEFDPFIVAADPAADKNYRFQGYQIYQLASEGVSNSDIGDESKARLVAQCDIEDDIARIINFEYDAEVEASTPVEKVDGENKGLQHSFLITEDLFAQGDKKLVNFKRYYYLAIAYAYNNYKTYVPDDASAIDGQKKQYIASRKAPSGEIKVVECIPHNPSPEADGTVHNISYGYGPLITRLDGYGNGGNVVNLHSSSVTEVLNTGYDQTPTYDYGSGPIKIKVVDPLNVADGYYECRFRNYDESIENAADTASWIIYRYIDGIIVDSIDSDHTIGIDPALATDPLISTNNEQLIPQWGVSVQITQRPYYFPDNPGSIDLKTTDLLSASLEFGDSSKQWLMGVPDNDAFYPTNWIRSGEYDPTHGTPIDLTDDDCTDAAEPTYRDYTDPCNYPDELNIDTDKKWAKILGGTVAPHRLVGYESSYAPMAYYGYTGVSGSPTAYRSVSSISFSPSVDIVLTSDQDLWTRCPVIELGRDAAFNVGGAQPGEMRKSPSLGTNGLPDGTGEGMSWFPGYAIDVESGARLYMAFGENSFLVTDNGSDMMWNPTNRIADDNGNPVMGGMHPVYVFSFHNKDKNNYVQGINYPYYDPLSAEDNSGNELYNDYTAMQGGDIATKKKVYGSISWVAYPIVATGYTFINPTDIPTTATISLRVNKEYKNFSAPDNLTGGVNGGMPMYSWSMDDIRTEFGSASELTSALDIINVVPNPYYAYSEYENNRLDSRVKITNLPERCTIKIYNAQGKLIKTFKKDSPSTFIDWLLINEAGIPVASGVHLIHVEVPEIGERILKAFISMRQVDLQNI